MPATMPKTSFIANIWNNYFSEQLWQATSATYFLYSYEYVYTALAVHIIFFLRYKTLLELEKTQVVQKVKFIQNQQGKQQNDVKDHVVVFSV